MSDTSQKSNEPDDKDDLKAEDQQPKGRKGAASELKADAAVLRDGLKDLAGKAEALSLKAEAPKVRAVVAPGRTVVTSTDGLTQRRAGPGSIVELAADEAASLRAGGFLTTGSADVDFADAPTTLAGRRGPTVNGDDGTLIRGSSR